MFPEDTHTHRLLPSCTFRVMKHVRTTVGELLFGSRGLYWGVKVGRSIVRLWHLVEGRRSQLGWSGVVKLRLGLGHLW